MSDKSMDETTIISRLRSEETRFEREIFPPLLDQEEINDAGRSGLLKAIERWIWGR